MEALLQDRHAVDWLAESAAATTLAPLGACAAKAAATTRHMVRVGVEGGLQGAGPLQADTTGPLKVMVVTSSKHTAQTWRCRQSASSPYMLNQHPCSQGAPGHVESRWQKYGMAMQGEPTSKGVLLQCRAQQRWWTASTTLPVFELTVCGSARAGTAPAVDNECRGPQAHSAHGTSMSMRCNSKRHTRGLQEGSASPRLHGTAVGE